MLTLAEAAEAKPGWLHIHVQRVRRALEEARALIVLPRPDGSIGRGVADNIALARELGREVRVVDSQGRLKTPEETSLEVRSTIHAQNVPRAANAE